MHYTVVAAMDNVCPLCRTPITMVLCMISLPFYENLFTIIAWLFNVTYTAILRAFELLTDVQNHYETMWKKLFDWVHVIDFA